MTTSEALLHLLPERTRRGAVMPFLAVAALLAAGGVAAARDKPPPKRDEPRKAATGCESIGDGYVKLPGSDTCVKVSGSTRSEGATINGR